MCSLEPTDPAGVPRDGVKFVISLKNVCGNYCKIGRDGDLKIYGNDVLEVELERNAIKVMKNGIKIDYTEGDMILINCSAIDATYEERLKYKEGTLISSNETAKLCNCTCEVLLLFLKIDIHFCIMSQQKEKKILTNIQIAFGLCKDLFNTCNYLKQHKIIYRHVKSGNMGVTENGALKIFKFGISMFEHETDDFVNRQAGIGTKAHSAPETSHYPPRYSYESDMWGFGCVVWCILFGVQRDSFSANPFDFNFYPEDVKKELDSLDQDSLNKLKV
ncbi:ephrin type-A receptor 4a-like isoform X1 [Entamoeba marina]